MYIFITIVRTKYNIEWCILMCARVDSIHTTQNYCLFKKKKGKEKEEVIFGINSGLVARHAQIRGPIVIVQFSFVGTFKIGSAFT